MKAQIDIIDAIKPKQIEEARRIFIDYEKSLGFSLSYENFDEELENLPGDYSPPSGCLLIAYYANELAGCVAIQKLADGVCEMKRLFVYPQFRKKNIGLSLTVDIINKARKLGYSKMRLDTLPSLISALKIYRYLGFKEIHPYRSNPFENAIFMELDLTGKNNIVGKQTG